MTKKIILFVAPSGSGKTSIIKGLLDDDDDLDFAISATTRPPRPAETEGQDYYFLSQTDFENRVLRGEFVEYAQVYRETFYGTLKVELERIWADGKTVLMDVDVKGAQAMQRQYSKTQLLTIFVKVKDLETLKDRLEKRGIAPQDLEKRLERVRFEWQKAHHFDRILLNDKLPQAISEAKSLIKHFLTQPH